MVFPCTKCGAMIKKEEFNKLTKCPHCSNELNIGKSISMLEKWINETFGEEPPTFIPDLTLRSVIYVERLKIISKIQENADSAFNKLMSSLVIIPPFSDFKARLTEILTATKLHFKLVYFVQKYLFPISTTEKEEKETAEIISLYSAKGYLLLGVLNVAQGSKKEQFDNANTYYQMGLRAFEKSINFLKTLDKHKIELLKFNQ